MFEIRWNTGGGWREPGGGLIDAVFTVCKFRSKAYTPGGGFGLG